MAQAEVAGLRQLVAQLRSGCGAREPELQGAGTQTPALQVGTQDCKELLQIVRRVASILEAQLVTAPCGALNGVAASAQHSELARQEDLRMGTAVSVAAATRTARTPAACLRVCLALHMSHPAHPMCRTRVSSHSSDEVPAMLPHAIAIAHAIVMLALAPTLRLFASIRASVKGRLGSQVERLVRHCVPPCHALETEAAGTCTRAASADVPRRAQVHARDTRQGYQHQATSAEWSCTRSSVSHPSLDADDSAVADLRARYYESLADREQLNSELAMAKTMVARLQEMG
ncbi:hypothetical protein HaLaN_10532, partial [Haematococcus lacustris]